MTNLFGGEISGSLDLVPRTKLCKIEEGGPTFQSHLDGSVHFFSPEISVETQLKLGADFIVALDECTSPLHNYDYTKVSMERSHRWEKRSLELLKRHSGEPKATPESDSGRASLARMTQEMFGVVQGGPFEDLRIQSAKFVSKNDFFGVGIGGALISNEKMIEILGWINPHLDPQKPRHLLGIGTVPEIFEAVEQGIDMFDCVHPTRIARIGYLLSKEHKKERFIFDISKAIYSKDPGPVVSGCDCYTCSTYSKAYLNHLFRSRELLSYRLATIHNLHFMMELMAEIRQAIAENRFAKLKEDWIQ